jgi:DNA-directed RNA polymerase subunit beta'
MKNFECSCGKYKGVRYKGIVCERCGVEVTTARVRRERMGHIELAAPVIHVWYVKATPSRVGLLLGLSVNEIEKILYYVKYVLVAPVTDAQKKEIFATLEEDLKNKLLELDAAGAQALADGRGKNEVEKLVADNKSAIEKEFNRVKSIIANLKSGATILESDYRNIFHKFDHILQFKSGSESIQKLLGQVDVNHEITTLIKNFGNYKGEVKNKALKLLRLLINLFISDVKPEWMVIKNLPVIPPDLRPVVQLDGGRFASSDVNLFYRRVLMRNIRLRKMIQVGMPDVVKKNEIRLLQESVNNLIVGEKNTGAGGAGIKVFKSLTDMLSGKEGIFRKNLLGKRVDYSGRSVITVGPHLNLDECGLPIYIAVKIFTPFIIGKLIERKIVYTPKQAEKLIKDEAPISLKILEEVIKDKFILLNRAPTLHRLSIEAFKIKLMPGKTIRLHPLVCDAFNADFDGDQMAVHLPLSDEAQKESRELIAATKNVLKPSSGEPTITHTQDMILGIYYLTDDYTPTPRYVGHFDTIEDVLARFNSKEIMVKDTLKLKVDGEWIETTTGRVIVNNILPDRIRFLNKKLVKKDLKGILDRIFDEYDMETTVKIADAIKNLGFKYATISATTVNIFDLVVPHEKEGLLKEGHEKVTKIYNFYFKGFISEEEKHRQIIRIWTLITKELDKLVKTNYKPGNNAYTMVDSGARGTWGQMTQLSGMKGLVQSPSGEIIELPIQSSLVEGFSPIEYFIAAHGARKGKADTALRTAESGYLTRRLCDSSQEVIVRMFDCGSHEFITISKDEADLRGETYNSLLFGRVVATDAKDSHGKVIMEKGTLLDKHNVNHLIAADIMSVDVRSPLTCHIPSGVCQQCFGMDLSTRKIVEIGNPVGIISSQSIGEPGTQLTMRTFHSTEAGVEADMTQGIRRVEELFEIRKPKKAAIVAPFDGVVSITEVGKSVELEIIGEPEPKPYIIKDGYKILVRTGQSVKKGDDYASLGKSKLKIKEEGVVLETHKDYITIGAIQRSKKNLGAGTTLRIKSGASVLKGQILSTGGLDIDDYKGIVGDLEAQKYIVREVKRVYTSQGQDVSDKYMEVIVKQLFSKVFVEESGDSLLIPGTQIKYEDFVIINTALVAAKKSPAKGKRLALGLTHIAKETDSWLSSASFQETIRVMVDNSLKGAIDNLDDLKSNVIIGRLLPVGEIYKAQVEAKNQKLEIIG